MIKCWYCNEEITSGNNPEHIGICDDCYKNTFGYGNEFIRNMIIKTTDLKHQLALTEKALELACETIKSMCPRPLWIGGTIPAPEVKDAEYFKEIAKEMIKSE